MPEQHDEPALTPHSEGSGARSEHIHGGLAGVTDRDELIEAADLENFMDVLLHIAQDELPLVRVELLHRDDEHPQAGTAEEVQMAEIDDQATLVIVDTIHDDRFKRTGVHAVDSIDR